MICRVDRLRQKRECEKKLVEVEDRVVFITVSLSLLFRLFRALFRRMTGLTGRQSRSPDGLWRALGLEGCGFIITAGLRVEAAAGV